MLNGSYGTVLGIIRLYVGMAYLISLRKVKSIPSVTVLTNSGRVH